jgi:hypothetical protein
VTSRNIPAGTTPDIREQRRARTQAPGRVGLYDPAFEHDACGVAFVARLDGVPSHETVQRGITALENLEHRGAAGADPRTGDGAGILMQLPDAFFRAVVEDELPPRGQYGVAVCFLPREDAARRAELQQLVVRTSRPSATPPQRRRRSSSSSSSPPPTSWRAIRKPSSASST